MHLHVWFFYIHNCWEWFSCFGCFAKVDLCTMIYLIVERDFVDKNSSQYIYLSTYLSIKMYKCDWVSVLWCDIDGLSLSIFFHCLCLGFNRVFFFNSNFFQFLFLLLFLFACVLLFTAHSSFRFVGNSSPLQLFAAHYSFGTIAPYIY